MINDKSSIDNRTIKAIGILLKLFTQEQRELLTISVGEENISLAEQLMARWWSYVPIADNPLVFKANAAQIIAVNSAWLDFINKLKEDNLFGKLLDPDNYKEKHLKLTRAKTHDKREIDTDTTNINLVKSLARTLGGDGGINRTYDYSSDWDRIDRAKLDNLKIDKEKIPAVPTETGQEDDTRGTDEEEQKKSWIDKDERLDRKYLNRGRAQINESSFSKGNLEIPLEQKIGIFDVTINHSTNATTGETAVSGNTFIEALKRQNYETTRERIILADAINNIHNIEFIDVREKIYKKLDPLFIHRGKKCQY